MSKSNLESGITQEEHNRIMSSQIKQLERENTRVVDQLKDVIKMNSHWQRYDAQREEYVVKLTKTNRELQDKVADLQRQMSEFDQRNLKASKEELPSELAFENLQIEDEERGSKNPGRKTGHLESLLLRKEEEIVTLTDQVSKLKDRVTELETGRDAINQKEEEEEVLLLREQINVCMEDFKQERKDRERCHDENMRLKDRLSQVENDLRANEEQLFVYQEQIKRLQERYRYEPRTYDEPCCCPDERPRPRHQVTPTYYYGDDLTKLPSDVEIDGPADWRQSNNFATRESTNDETDGCLETQSDFATIKSTDYKPDGVSKGPQDEVLARFKSANHNIDGVSEGSQDDIGDDIHTTLKPSDMNIYGCLQGPQPTEVGSSEDEDIYGSPKGSKDETGGALKPCLVDFQKDNGIDHNNNTDDWLQCPRCLASFDVHQHCELLDHVNICLG